MGSVDFWSQYDQDEVAPRRHGHAVREMQAVDQQARATRLGVVGEALVVRDAADADADREPLDWAGAPFFGNRY